jgi:lipopolysaccharide export system permease protein
MKLLDQYIAKTVLSGIGLITLILTGLHGFILFVSQLDDLGKGDYGVMQAAWVVLLNLPYQVYLFFPVASLLGSLVGLSVLANHRELLVMRAAGLSISQVILSVFKVAVMLILAVTLLGETFIPKLSMHARDEKMQALSTGQAIRTSTGVWLRYRNDFLMLGEVISNTKLKNVVQFHFDKQHHLQFTRQLDSVEFLNGQWHATNVEETQLNVARNQIQATQFQTLIWDVKLNPRILRISQNEPDEMSLSELHRYLHAKNIHQSLSNYELAYWQRIIQPLTTVVMMILAIPFVFGPLRSSSMGAKLLTGVSVGFGFHMMNHFFGPVAQVFQWPPAIAALAPTLCFALLGVYLMKRVKR